MPVCEPFATELSRTIEKELMSQVDPHVAKKRQKSLTDLYMGKPPPLRTAGRKAVERPPTPKWLFRGNTYHGIAKLEDRDRKVQEELVAERLRSEREQVSSRASNHSDATDSSSRKPKEKPLLAGYGGGTMDQWVAHMKTLPGGRNWLDR
eukprot:TRINITY_DN29104_c0_g1_i1.p1 TRINITY_DN29104_c0_g1~~TRINITY_DN29104_c0_g1_i1.p1  ORF type:complete len:171 (-),score=19.31 TRINITY_DN29104_c0_g1_i1:117-566(-)